MTGRDAATHRRMLILDDDADVGQTIQWIAESLGFQAEFVTQPAKFFEKLAQTCPDVITIDLVMPAEWERGCWTRRSGQPRHMD
jgi:CheY-like chemotaxis protein